MELISILKQTIEFDNTSLNIDLKNASLIDFFETNDLSNSEEKMAEYICDKLNIKKDYFEVDQKKSKLLIFNNNSDIYFLEEYLEQNKFFLRFLDFLKSKDFNNKINYINSEGTNNLKEMTDDKKLFTSIVQKNNLNTGRIEETKLMIPPNLFSEISSVENNTFIYEFLANFFSLFAISEKTEIERMDTEDKFIFIMNDEHNQSIYLKINWPDFNNEKEVNENNEKIKYFYDCYTWIINSNKDISIETLLSVVRNYIKRTGEFSLDTNWELGLDSILDQIIKRETDRYFDHVLKLRDEYKYLTDMKFDLRQKMMQRTLATVTAIAVGFFGKIFTESIILDYKLELDVFLNSDILFAAIFFYGTVVFGGSIYLLNDEYKEIIEYYNQIKDIFVNKFLFNEEEYKNIVGQIEDDSLIKKYRNLLWALTILCFLIGVMFLIGWSKILVGLKFLLNLFLTVQILK